MGCVGDRTLEDLAAGTLDRDGEREARAHIDGCPLCQGKLEPRAAAAHTGDTRDLATDADPIDNATVLEGVGRQKKGLGLAQDRKGLPRGTPLGRYLLIDRIGKGGMGVVYAAYDPELHRRVALKLLLPEISRTRRADAGRARLLREAQAMARLSHPNVIHVYDVGTFEDHVFLALEFIDGDTVQHWLKVEHRPWRDVLRVFVAAGRGLAAAHAAGLVHRDFKPDNILLGADGRVLVTDFGLARAEGEDVVEPEAGDADPADDATPPPPSLPRARGSAPSLPTPLSTPLTKVGAVMGTPGYVAPEHIAGALADARSDQFAFAAALWFALYRRRPFAGATLVAYAKALAKGPPEPAPGAGVPTWLRRVVERGLALDPAARFRTMDEMLDALSADPARRRRWLYAGGGMVAAIGAAVIATVVATGGDDSAALCTGAERKLAGVWDLVRRAAVEQAFRATDRPYASDTFTGVARRLDDRAGAWTAMHTETCEATRRRGEQPESVMAARMACLDQRLRELGQLVDVFAAADGTVVDRAIQATGALSPLDGCADLTRLLAAVPPPGDAATRARVDEIQTQLGRAKALGDAGKFKDALAVATTATAAARDAEYPPALAEALVRQGELHLFLGDGEASAAALREGVRVADASGHDVVRATGYAWLVGVVGYNLEKGAEGLALAEDARAALARAGGDPRIEAILESSLGRTYSATGDYAKMLEHHESSLTIRRRILGDDDPQTANAQNNVAAALHAVGRIRDALAAHRATLAVREKALGRDHPDVAMSLSNIGSQLYELGDLEEALRAADEALAIARRSLPAKHATILSALSNRAGMLAELGRLDEAKASYDELIATLTAELPRSGRMARALANSANDVLVPTGHARQALAAGVQAVVLATAASGDKTDDVALGLTAQASAQEALGQVDAALATDRRALAIYEGVLGADAPTLGDLLTTIGRLELRQGRGAEARAALTRALAIYDRAGVGGKWLAKTQFGLARALAATGERARAIELAQKARDWYAASPLTADLAAIDAWLAAEQR